VLVSRIAEPYDPECFTPMRRYSSLLVLAVLMAAGLPACNDGRPDRDEVAARAPVDFGPTAAYERRFLFLGPGQLLPSAAIVDLVALSDSVGVRRGVRARVSDGTDWLPLMDEGWDMAWMREPWRLVPHGSLRLVLGDAGELAALVFRADMEVRVEPGSALAGYSPDPGTQLVLRQARLALGADLVHGILLDAQLGRGVDPAMSRSVRSQPGSGAPNEATPIGQPGTEALLTDNDGFYLVFAAAGAGPMGWIHYRGRDDVRRGAHLTAVAWEETEGVQVPNAWQVAGQGELTGELTAEALDGVDLADVAGIEALGYAVVSGWVADQDVRRDVFGLIRHIR
jgi:hypothetical protein